MNHFWTEKALLSDFQSCSDSHIGFVNHLVSNCWPFTATQGLFTVLHCLFSVCGHADYLVHMLCYDIHTMPLYYMA